MKTPVFKGASVAIVTPFHPDGSVNFEKLGDLIEFQIQNGTAAITICGTTGEASTLSDTEHKQCISYAVKKTAGRIPVIAGTGSNDTMYALELSCYAEEAGADALLMVTPYYNKTTQRGLIAHYTYIADRVNLPIILYNVPSRTGMCFTADTYFQLSKHPNINGVKEAGGNFALMAETRFRCGDELNLWSGNDDETVPILSLGGHGVISVVSNVYPRLMADICSLYFEGREKESADRMISYFDLMHNVFVEVNPIPVKAAMNLMGMDVGGTRMPLYEIAPANLDLLKKTLERVGLIRT